MATGTIHFRQLGRRVIVATVVTAVLAACSDNDSGRSSLPAPPPPEVEPVVEVLYDSTASPPVLPFPNAIYTGEDGRLALPLPPDTAPDNLGNPWVSVNTLDGFSTIAPIAIGFAEEIDNSSIQAGDNVRLFEVTTDDGDLPGEVFAELEAGVDYSVSVSAVQNSTLLLKPLRPLRATSRYLVGVTNDLLAGSGLRMGPSADYEALRAGTPDPGDAIDTTRLSEMVQAQEALLESSGMPSDRIVVSLSFQTQSTSGVLDNINAVAESRAITLSRPTMILAGQELPLTTAPFIPTAALFGLTPAGQADIYTGTIQLPYYMNVPTSETDDSVLDSFIKDSTGQPLLPSGNGPVATTVTVPVLLTIPNTSVNPDLLKPAAGWPIAIYQHGITGNRTNVLAIADALAAEGVATIAIDQPLHGVVPGDLNELLISPYGNAGVSFYQPEFERHFNLDLDNNGRLDLGGTHYSSDRNLLAFRDNLRQCVSDLIYLARSIPDIALPDSEQTWFDPTRIHFFSLSLGSMVGTMLAGTNTDIVAFALAAPGGGNSKFAEGAPDSNAEFIAALTGLGFEQGTQSYEDVVALITTTDGPGDPVNYAQRAGERHPVYINEITGDGTEDNPPDQTIPNTVLNNGAYAGLVAETAPLAGTEPLIRLMNLQALLDSTMDAAGLHIVARMVQGIHASQVNFFPVPTATHEIQRQTATFLASDGKRIEVENTDLLEMNFMPTE